MMSARAELNPSVVDRIKATLVGLRMPRALEIVDAIVRQLERGEVSALEAIDAMLAEEFTLRESRRIKTSLVMPGCPTSRRSPASTSRSSLRLTATGYSLWPS